MKFLKKFWPFFLIVAIVLVAYGQTLGMYFYQDDSALIFKLQHPEGRAGSFGVGLWERGAYQYLVVPFVPFFRIFSLEPFGYFLIGLITYLIATFSFYLFSKKFFNNDKASFFSTLIFAAGYLGSDTMFRIINSWQTNIGLTLALLTLYFYTSFLKENKFKGYLFGLLFYFLSIELVFIRSHSLIFIILILDFLFKLLPFDVRKLPKFLLRQMPFMVLFKIYYLQDQSFGGPGIVAFFKEIFLKGHIEKLSSIFANTGNALVPDILQTKIYFLIGNRFLLINFLMFIFSTSLAFLMTRKFKLKKTVFVLAVIANIISAATNLYFYNKNLYWYKDIQTALAGSIGMYGIVFALFLAWVLWKRLKIISISLVLGLTVVVSQIFGYYLQYPDAIFGTTHRYFSYSLIGYSLIFGSLFYLYERKYKSNILLIFFLGLTLFLSVNYQSKILSQRSIPTRKFYSDLKNYVPYIKKGDIFYFDVAHDGLSQKQFGDFFSVGSMPETTALAIYYGVDRYDISMFSNFDELTSYLSKNLKSIDNLYSFYYRGKGLVSTTAEVRKILREGSPPRVFQNLEKLDIKPFTDTALLFTSIQTPVTALSLPGLKGEENLALDDKLKIIKYLVSRRDYYRMVKATSLSEWKYREVRNVSDGDSETAWQGHRIWWHDNKREVLTIDLGSIHEVAGIYWQNWNTALTPTKYSIEISVDGIRWTKVKDVKGGEKKSGEWVFDKFNSTLARFVRMTITETLADDSPAISEIEVIDGEFIDIDLLYARQVWENPMLLVENESDWENLKSELAKIGRIKVSWTKDKNEGSKNFVWTNINLGKSSTSFIIPAGGTSLNNISFEPNIPIDIKILNISAKSLSLKDMINQGLIKEFKEN